MGGTNPSLLEAMAVGKTPLYLDVPFNHEVAGEAGFLFPKNTHVLTIRMDELTGSLHEMQTLAERARTIIRERYSWSLVTDEYENCFTELWEMIDALLSITEIMNI